MSDWEGGSKKAGKERILCQDIHRGWVRDGGVTQLGIPKLGTAKEKSASKESKLRGLEEWLSGQEH